MYTKIEKAKENKSIAIANFVTRRKGVGKQCFDLVDNRSEGVAQRKPHTPVNSVLLSNKLPYSFFIPKQFGLKKNDSQSVVQKAVNLAPQYCQQNNEWYAVHMTDSCFQHFQQNQHQNVVTACIETLIQYTNRDWTTFNETSLEYNGWHFVCTWIDNTSERYLRVFHADAGYKLHSGKKEENRDFDRRKRFNSQPGKDPFGGKDPSKMSSDEISRLLDL